MKSHAHGDKHGSYVQDRIANNDSGKINIHAASSLPSDDICAHVGIVLTHLICILNLQMMISQSTMNLYGCCYCKKSKQTRTN